ncbi:hypothetical protein GPECTOR_17g881 [Gonium pectorale]|uniref:Phospholipase B-like n=1 Tax=Gonium pectorale TaxID=33097 RepID=A0A150GK78_GONPE|nr:hypothetical protein GPECTOR_17g881 [Gonium pectorale]|eukprot:KXZ50243.1 hypothetical protein GPECTOR_17g881 [Gonium pectorale]
MDTILRGKIYAINAVDIGRSFQLVHVEPAQLTRYAVTDAASLAKHLRVSYPAENVGWAWYADTYQDDGWYRLELRIDEDAPFPDVVKARAAGFVEGNLQGSQMYSYWTNYRVNQYRGKGEAPSEDLYEWLDEQYGWMTRKVEAATGWSLDVLRGAAPPPPGGSAAGGDGMPRSLHGAATDGGSGGVAVIDAVAAGEVNLEPFDQRYWSLVGLVAAQFEGLTAGFWAAVTDAGRNMTWRELYALNALGDMYELNVLFPPGDEKGEEEVKLDAQGAEEARGAGAKERRRKRRRQYSPGHGKVDEYGYGELLDCSAMIKIDKAAPGGDSGDVDGGDDVEGASEGANLKGVTGGVLGRRGGGGLAAEVDPEVAVAQQRRQRRLHEDHPPQRKRATNFWASHNTWRSYFEMVRTWKVYDLPYSATGPLTVSSSPGLLHSKDDWYTTDTFVVMETTNGIYNKDLYDLIQPKCVLMWQRVQVANFGARTGGEWVDLFERHNSGTYNNQWMVLDVPRLEDGRRTGVLWVLEQVPGAAISRDVSKVLLDQGYWASYNVPYFPEIYNITGYPQPSIYSTCPRARIFSREQGSIASRADLQALMRLNRYQHDPLSGGMPNAAIAARYDLPALPGEDGQPRNWTRRAYGAVDVKLVDAESFRQRRTYVINGPTSDDQPVFSWTADPAFASVRREGLPDSFHFGWHAYQSVMGPPVGLSENLEGPGRQRRQQ